jgi:hypothetical protein
MILKAQVPLFFTGAVCWAAAQAGWRHDLPVSYSYSDHDFKHFFGNGPCYHLNARYRMSKVRIRTSEHSELSMAITSQNIDINPRSLNIQESFFNLHRSGDSNETVSFGTRLSLTKFATRLWPWQIRGCCTEGIMTTGNDH